METVNLDSMTVEQLQEFWSEIDADITSAANKYGLSESDMKLYGRYAANKWIAMYHREAGSIDRAIQFESICDRTYQQMTVKQW